MRETAVTLSPILLRGRGYAGATKLHWANAAPASLCQPHVTRSHLSSGTTKSAKQLHLIVSCGSFLFFRRSLRPKAGVSFSKSGWTVVALSPPFSALSILLLTGFISFYACIILSKHPKWPLMCRSSSSFPPVRLNITLKSCNHVSVVATHTLAHTMAPRRAPERARQGAARRVRGPPTDVGVAAASRAPPWCARWADLCAAAIEKRGRQLHVCA